MKKQFKAESKRLLELMIHSIYTHRDIFLRELLSNASDAIDKLAYLSLTDDQVGIRREDFAIAITRDAQAGTLTISDNGIGMSREELEENLGTICKSGSLGFKQALDENADVDIIGQFGVGFYSAFMVASTVTVITRKYGQEEAYCWISNGADGYTIRPATREAAGTDVILTLKEDCEEENYSRFLEEWELRELVKKYSDYIRFPIRMEVTQRIPSEEAPDGVETQTQWQTLNSMIPLWQKPKSEVTQEEYHQFYTEKFHDFEAPARILHTSAEGMVSFKALLFIPAQAPMDFHTTDFKAGLQLYSSGVLIMENCEALLPEYFSFVRGVVDSQDLHLNISRELLQHDRQLSMIARNLEKKIRAELQNMLENERESYERLYSVFSRQLKFGVVADYGAHKDSVKDLLLFYSHRENKLISLKEYVQSMSENQEKIYYLSAETTARAAQMPQVRTLAEKGYDVLLCTDEVDEFVHHTLRAYEEKPLCNAATEDLGLQSEEEKKALEDKSQQLQGLLDFAKETLADAVSQVRLSGDLADMPVCMTPGGGMSFEMEKYLRRVDPDHPIPSTRILELNPEHPAVQALQKAFLSDTAKAKDYVLLLHAQALLLADLPLEDPAAYTALVCKLM